MIDATPFEYLDYACCGVELTHEGSAYEVYSSPYSLPIDVTAETLLAIPCAGTLEHVIGWRGQCYRSGLGVRCSSPEMVREWTCALMYVPMLGWLQSIEEVRYMGEILSRCGYRCDLCLAYRPNVEVNPSNQQALNDGWFEYFGLRIPPEELVCDGCMADTPQIDRGCPVRPCVIRKGLANCSECDRLNQ